MKVPKELVRAVRCPVCRTGENFPKEIGRMPGDALCLFHLDLYQTCIVERDRLVDPAHPERFHKSEWERVLREVTHRHTAPDGTPLMNEV